MYYVVYGVLYAFSLLPFRILYFISDGVYALLYYIIRYRRDVVMQNLLIAFPEKTEAERITIAKGFYKNFVDNFIEVIKLLSLPRKEVDKRFTCSDYSVINDVYKTGKNMQIHLGHFFNWEMANLAYAMHVVYPLLVVYMPIKNQIFNRIFYKARTRFGTQLVAATKFRQDFQPHQKGRYALVLVGDQNPGGPDRAYWTDFFGRKTPFVLGPEKGARLKKAAVVMVSFKKVKRGYYASYPQLLTLEPRSLPDGEITRRMAKFVEDSVRKDPSNYLWSHRRWKYEYVAEKYEKLLV